MISLSSAIWPKQHTRHVDDSRPTGNNNNNNKNNKHIVTISIWCDRTISTRSLARGQTAINGECRTCCLYVLRILKIEWLLFSLWEKKRIRKIERLVSVCLFVCLSVWFFFIPFVHLFKISSSAFNLKSKERQELGFACACWQHFIFYKSQSKIKVVQKPKRILENLKRTIKIEKKLVKTNNNKTRKLNKKIK